MNVFCAWIEFKIAGLTFALLENFSTQQSTAISSVERRRALFIWAFIGDIYVCSTPNDRLALAFSRGISAAFIGYWKSRIAYTTKKRAQICAIYIQTLAINIHQNPPHSQAECVRKKPRRERKTFQLLRSNLLWFSIETRENKAIHIKLLWNHKKLIELKTNIRWERESLANSSAA